MDGCRGLHLDCICLFRSTDHLIDSPSSLKATFVGQSGRAILNIPARRIKPIKVVISRKLMANVMDVTALLPANIS